MQTNQGRVKSIGDKLKSLRPQLRHLNNVEFKGITMKIDQERAALKVITIQLGCTNKGTLIITSSCRDKLVNWSSIFSKKIVVSLCNFFSLFSSLLLFQNFYVHFSNYALSIDEFFFYNLYLLL